MLRVSKAGRFQHQRQQHQASLRAVAQLGSDDVASATSSQVSRFAAFFERRSALEMALRQDSPCSDARSDVTREQCLEGKNADCMWIATDKRNLCLPCRMGAAPLPCPPVDAVFAMKKVTACDMKCGHQSVLTKDSPCTDYVSGEITQSQCMSKGVSALTTCMWTT